MADRMQQYVARPRRAAAKRTPAERIADHKETPEIDAANKWVLVIGGGDAAMDSVRTAVRQGAAGVTCLYRRDRANMPGSAREVEHVEEEGTAFGWQSQPEALMDVPVGVIASRPELEASAAAR